ncbi:MAG: UbiA family prenyltransferase [Deltaproteobacteria bacterium]|nr:UbiA family prenyltransferase [Deltaproteobacteria bacterium]
MSTSQVSAQPIGSDGVAKWSRLIALPHTVFAFPFALSILLLISRVRPVSAAELLWIISALVSARTAAMTFNRIADKEIDARNPRTQNRELPRKVVSVRAALVLLIASSALFFLSSAMLGEHCLLLAPPVLLWLFFYSWSKRFTRFSHLILGISLALAPGGVWYALTATVSWQPVVMMLAVALWVAGFDIIYSCQDVEFDKRERLFSLPAVLGIPSALFWARVIHAASILLLLWFGGIMECGAAYHLGTFVFALLLMRQHFLVTAADLSRVNSAFFTHNGAASLVYLAGVFVDTQMF